jgi:hypothetical protein
MLVSTSLLVSINYYVIIIFLFFPDKMSVAPALTTDHKKNTPSQVYIGTK